MGTGQAPAIYVRSHVVEGLRVPGRLWAAAVSAGCLAVLITAARLVPNQDGVGTHTALGMQGCQFLQRTGLPCPSCGMTTAFALFMHGRVATSFYVQPMGALLCGAAVVLFWGAGYIAVTGRPIHRLTRVVPLEKWILPILMLAVLAWAWKIGIHLTHHDGF